MLYDDPHTEFRKDEPALGLRGSKIIASSHSYITEYSTYVQKKPELTAAAGGEIERSAHRRETWLE